MHVPAPLPAGGAPQRPCASVPLTPALSPKRAVAAPLQATDHLSNPAPTALPTAARGGSARMDGTAWRVGTGGGALQVRPPNGRGRGEQTSPPHGGGERRFRATGACRLQVRQAECFFKGNRFQVAYSAVRCTRRCLGGSRGHGGQQLGAAAQGPVRGRPLHALRGAGGWRRLVRSALACAEGPGG
jgi:hypothetical protein